MDENVMRVLQMLQEGKVSAQEAESLIAALRGETIGPKPGEKPEEKVEEAPRFNFQPPKLDLDDLGERISKAISRVEPEKILKRIQTQIRTVSKSGVNWSASVSSKVRTWTDGDDNRPTNEKSYPEIKDTFEQKFHLEPGAQVFVENPLGNVKLLGDAADKAHVVVNKTVWSSSNENLQNASSQIETTISCTDSRLDIKTATPSHFHDGTVDLEIHVPVNVNVRVSTRYGAIKITAIEGRAEAVTTTGDLYLHDLGGDVRAESVNGDIRLEHILGAATVATQSGDIEANDIKRGLSANSASGEVSVQHIDGGRVECKSVSGDVKAEKLGTGNPLDITLESISGGVTLETAQGNIALKAVSGDIHASGITAARMQAQTVSGDVDLRLTEAFSGMMQVNTVSGDISAAIPEGSNARVSLSTHSGEILCEHEATAVTTSDTLWSGQIGTGAGTINIQTLSGDTLIKRA